MDTGESFAACEWLLKKHANLWLKIDDVKPEVRRAIIGPYVPPIPKESVERMKQLKASGLSIGEIAKECKVSWRTAWKHSKVKKCS